MSAPARRLTQKSQMFEPAEINVLCSDLEHSLGFYRETLGFTVLEEDQGAIRMRLGSMVLLLLPVAESAAPERAYGS